MSNYFKTFLAYKYIKIIKNNNNQTMLVRKCRVDLYRRIFQRETYHCLVLTITANK